MARTKLYAVERKFDHPQISGAFESRFMVYKPANNPRGVTWTTSIAKASRWMNYHDARRYLSEIVQEYDIPFSRLSVKEC